MTIDNHREMGTSKEKGTGLVLKASSLKPQASSLKPQASSLKPQVVSHV
jgi:hypothetical protein